jgi:hypothetical protein
MSNTIYRAIIAPCEQNSIEDLIKMGFELMKNEMPTDNEGKLLVLFQHKDREKSLLYASTFKVEDFMKNVTYPCKLEETTADKVTKKLIAWLHHKDGG